jgi:hypothetical protein
LNEIFLYSGGFKTQFSIHWVSYSKGGF